MQKEALIEEQGNALLSAEAVLKAARAEIDEGRKRIEGKYLRRDSVYLILPRLIFVSTQSCGRWWRRSLRRRRPSRTRIRPCKRTTRTWREPLWLHAW